MPTQNFIAAHCSAPLKKTKQNKQTNKQTNNKNKTHFSSYDDPAMKDSNPDDSAISKL